MDRHTRTKRADIDRAILRRMMFAIELRQPPPPVRQHIWARQLERHGIQASVEDARALANEFDATPGVAAGAVAAAALLRDGDLGAVRRGVQSLSRLLDCEKPDQGVPRGFNPAFMQSDEDLEALAERLCATGKQRFSLCLQGPPGTGKSAWTRYLADRLGLQVSQKRASDLMSMWVGQTEKNIARAFREAADDGSFLVFDEADSLLADRRGANRSLGNQPGQRDCSPGWSVTRSPSPAPPISWRNSTRPPCAASSSRSAWATWIRDRRQRHVPRLVQPAASRSAELAAGPDPRRLRRSPPKSRNPGPPERPGRPLHPLESRVRSQTQPNPPHRLRNLT